MYEYCFVLHYGELALKLKNRNSFEDALIKFLQKQIASLKGTRLKKFRGRLVVFYEDVSLETALKERLLCIPGIVFFAKGYFYKKFDEDLVVDKIIEKKDFLMSFKTFALRIRRTDKDLPKTSTEYAYSIGQKLGKKDFIKDVDLKKPEIEIFIDLFPGGSILFFEKHKATGGLPIGTGSKMISLISSGFDSPVASWKMIRRGQRNVFVHFHSYPHASQESIDNTKEIVEVLARYQGESTLFMVPLIDFQKEVMFKVDERYRIILYRRMMYRIAERIAYRVKAKGLITGESVAQVASQTPHNIIATSEVCSLPIYRPLCGDDKTDIIDLARRIGTADISTRQDEECCSMFMPKAPILHSDLEVVKQEEEKIDIKKFLIHCCDEREKIMIKPDWYK